MELTDGLHDGSRSQRECVPIFHHSDCVIFQRKKLKAGSGLLVWCGVGSRYCGGSHAMRHGRFYRYRASASPACNRPVRMAARTTRTLLAS